MTMEYCEEDKAINDEHTNHSNGDINHGASCLANADYITPKMDNEVKCKVSCDNPNHFHIYPTLFFFTNLLAYNLDNYNNIKPEYGEDISFYVSAETSRFHGFRAPPSILS